MQRQRDGGKALSSMVQGFKGLRRFSLATGFGRPTPVPIRYRARFRALPCTLVVQGGSPLPPALPLLAAGYLLLATCSGCGLAEKALVTLIAPNPELKRLEAQKETTKDGIEAVKDPAVDKEKAKQIVRLVESSQRQGHPSFFSAVVSGLYTEEGRRLAGLAVVALGSMIALGLRVASTWGLPGAFASTVKGIQDFKEGYAKDSLVRKDLNASLAKRHSGIRVNVVKKVKKILGEV